MTRSPEDIQDLVGKIAVIGMAGRYPGSRNIEEFWNNLKESRECITFFQDAELLAAGVDPALLRNTNYVKAQGVCEGTYWFDASAFGYTPAEAEFLDPQHRALLECSWEALEQAGYDPWRYPGRIGVFAGCGQTHYLFELLSMPDIWEHISPFALPTYNDKDFLATRVGYDLNLRGPCVTVQTACSTSLVSIVMACQSLLSYQCDITLAGGVTLSTKEHSGYLYQEGGIVSPDGRCRAFDADAKGIVGGSGAGIVVLKRLEDAIADHDTIHAVVVGMGLNNDGASRVGFTAPGRDGQVAVIKDAIAMAGINPETIGFVECHGTGTPIGDPIEVAALTRAFRAYTKKNQFCAIGSVKTNIGHTDTAAGVAGFTKAILALKQKMIPASLHFHRPNPEIDFENSPFYVSTELREWPSASFPRRAGVTSLGAGGTNAHVILEEGPDIKRPSGARPWHLLVWSAKTSSALETMTTNLLTHLIEHTGDSIGDVAYTLQVGRRSFPHRRILVCRSHFDAVESLQQSGLGRFLTGSSQNESTPVAFLFPGQGPQYVNMGKDLHFNEPHFRRNIDYCAEVLQQELAVDIRTLLYPREVNEEAAGQLDQIQYTTPILFAVEYALAKLWIEWGLKPDCMLGHSTGEYVAACLAEVLSLEDALCLVAARGRLMQQLPHGSMMAVLLTEEELLSSFGSIAGLSVAVINGPSACVVSGPTEAVTQLEQELGRKEVPCRTLRISHASHSAMMDPILGDFRSLVQKIELRRPKLRYLSNLSGTWITPSEATSPDYWVNHLRHTVRFSAGLEELFKDERRIFLEAGPGRMLSSLVTQHPERKPGHIALSSLPHPKNDPQTDLELLLASLGQLWLEGVPIDWQSFHAEESHNRIPLPTYPFERQYYRRISTVAPKNASAVAPSHTAATTVHTSQRPNMATVYVAPRNELEESICSVWRNTLGIHEIGINDNFVHLGGHSLLALQLATRMKRLFGIELSVRDLYKKPTIAEMTEAILELLVDNADQATISQILEAEEERSETAPPNPN